VIDTLLVTVLIEGVIAISYSLWRRKPVLSILITSIFANLLTQSLLWIALKAFFQHYLVTLFIAEFLIWLLESILLFGFRSNKLSPKESLFLSLLMNLSSFALGWWLPI
jgi:hypothetical protein